MLGCLLNIQLLSCYKHSTVLSVTMYLTVHVLRTCMIVLLCAHIVINYEIMVIYYKKKYNGC